MLSDYGLVSLSSQVKP